MDEETLRVVADVLESDNFVRTAVINNLNSSGEMGLQEMGYEIGKRLSDRHGINLSDRDIAKALSKPFEWGMERYMADYDARPLEQEQLLNSESQVDYNSVEHASSRVRHVSTMIEQIEWRGQVPNYYWQDFPGRGYNAIRDRILYDFGENAAKQFDYYEWHDVRDTLRAGIMITLNKAHDNSIGEVQNMQYATRKLEGMVEEASKANEQVSELASLFR